MTLAPTRPRPGGRTPTGSPDSDPRPRPTRHRWEWWFAVAVLVLATGSFFPLLVSTGSADPGPIARGIWAVTYVVAGFALLDGALRQRLRARLPLALLLYATLTLVSVAWSVLPAITMRRSVGFVGTILVGMFLAQRLRPLGLLLALQRAALIVAVASLLLFASGSPLAIDQTHDTLRGVLSTKNSLGRLMAVGLLATATTALLDRRWARSSTLASIPMVVALSLTDSTGGSLVAAAVVLCMVGALLWRKRAGRILLPAAVALALGTLAIILPRATAENVTGLLGEDATLTGRTDIWALTLDAIATRPLLGHGYESFWYGAELAERIRWQLGWPTPNAHNGLLDVAVDLGVVGAVLAVLVLVTLVVQGLRDVRDGNTEGAFLRLPLAGLTVLSTLAESGLLTQNNLLTVLLIAALCSPRPVRRSLRGASPPLPDAPSPAPPPGPPALTTR